MMLVSLIVTAMMSSQCLANPPERVYPLTFFNMTLMDARTEYESFAGPDLYIMVNIRKGMLNDGIDHDYPHQEIFRTNIVDNTKFPVFNQVWTCSATICPDKWDRFGFTNNHDIILTVMDSRTIGSDVWIGTCVVFMRDVLQLNQKNQIRSCTAEKDGL